MYNDNVVGFVDFKDFVSKFLVYVVVVGLLYFFSMVVGGFVLFVVEEGVEVVFGIVFLFCLVF